MILKMKRYGVPGAILCVVLSLFNLALSTEGMVLCIAHDHTAIELAREGKCVPVAANSKAQPSHVVLLKSLGQTGCTCDPCLDLPLGTNALALVPPVQDKGHCLPSVFLDTCTSSASHHRDDSLLLSSMALQDAPEAILSIVSVAVLRI